MALVCRDGAGVLTPLAVANKSSGTEELPKCTVTRPAFRSALLPVLEMSAGLIFWRVVAHCRDAGEMAQLKGRSLRRAFSVSGRAGRRLPGGSLRESPASRKLFLASAGCKLRQTRPWLGLVDLSRVPCGTFFREVHPGSEMASQNDQNKAK